MQVVIVIVTLCAPYDGAFHSRYNG